MSRSRSVRYPLLHPSVLNAFVEQYKVQRSVKDSGFFAAAVNFNDITPMINEISKNLDKRFAAARETIDLKMSADKVLEQWLDVVRFLIEKANEMQSRPLDKMKSLMSAVMPTYVAKKTGVEHTDSTFTQTLHALRSMIIFQLNTSEDYKQAFNNHKNSLIAEKDKLQAEIKNDKIQGLNVSHKEDRLKIVLSTLTSLGDRASAIDACEAKFLSSYCMPTVEYISQSKPEHNINIHIPLCFQENWHKIFYETIFRATTQQNFEDFVKTALKTKPVLENKALEAVSEDFAEIELDSSESSEESEIAPLPVPAENAVASSSSNVGSIPPASIDSSSSSAPMEANSKSSGTDAALAATSSRESIAAPAGPTLFSPQTTTPPVSQPKKKKNASRN